mgnify:CR=1 FL=1
MTQPDLKPLKSLGVEISSSMLVGVLLDEKATIARTEKKTFDRAADSIEQVIDFVRDFSTAEQGIEALGIAVPGLIHKESRKVAFSTHIPEHSDMDLAAGIKEAFDLPIIVENDANAAAFGEFRIGAGRESRDLFFATIGAGVGGAFIFDGQLWHGVAGFAGEFGYVAINAEGMRLEDVASSANVVRRTLSRIRQDNTSSLSNLEEGSLGICEILVAANTEDDLAKMMLERTGEYVGTAIASVINLLNIETIVLGGQLMEAGHLVLDAVVSRARELSFGPSFHATRILAGTLGRNAAAAGAALLASHSHDTTAKD